jgi:hypothetical protein
MVTRVGVVGLSEGNGHPFSFSAIINGYSDSGLANAGWRVIYDYVRRRNASEFGIDGLQVTHAWTQEPEHTRKLCAACLIPHAVEELEQLIDLVDAVIIARDDYENHWAMARTFLENDLPVFLDKPLSLNPKDLPLFKPYLERGKLMSCSGMRYAMELDLVRAEIHEYGALRLVRGTVLNSWEKYGVHLLDAILNVVHSKPLSVSPHPSTHSSVAISTDDDCLLLLDALGDCPKTFRIDFFGTKRISTHEITDNFSMFRRTLWHFSEMIRTRQPAIPPQSSRIPPRPSVLSTIRGD